MHRVVFYAAYSDKSHQVFTHRHTHTYSLTIFIIIPVLNELKPNKLISVSVCDESHTKK